MNRIRNLVGKINKDGKFFKRLVIVLGIIAGIALLIILSAYLTRSQIRYTLQKADCSQAGIDARNQEEGGNSRACVLIISATNLKNTSESVDWLGTGGGPLAGWRPMIRINAPGKRFCYAGVNFNDIDNLGPYESRDLRIGCASSENMPKEYDERSDENPISIEINDWSEVMLLVEPIR